MSSYNDIENCIYGKVWIQLYLHVIHSNSMHTQRNTTTITTNDNINNNNNDIHNLPCFRFVQFASAVQTSCIQCNAKIHIVAFVSVGLPISASCHRLFSNRNNHSLICFHVVFRVLVLFLQPHRLSAQHCGLHSMNRHKHLRGTTILRSGQYSVGTMFFILVSANN